MTMNDNSHCIARLHVTDKNRQRFGVVSVWSGKFAGTYSIRRDKGSDKYPSIGLLDALKAFAAGELYADVSIMSERKFDAPRGGGGLSGGSNNSFGDENIPF